MSLRYLCSNLREKIEKSSKQVIDESINKYYLSIHLSSASLILVPYLHAHSAFSFYHE